MRDNDALLQAIRDDPEDDAVRLVYADWLEDQGETERAGFIRLQIESPRLPDGHPRRREMEKQERALLKKYAAEWFAPPKSWKVEEKYRVRRGFPDTLQGSLQDTRDHRAWLARWPIVRLRPDHLNNDPSRVHALAEAPFLGGIRELDLRNFRTVLVLLRHSVRHRQASCRWHSQHPGQVRAVRERREGQ
jgi:uncharacterized protein (TIGR02996 family)